MQPRVSLVTGANSGIGKATALGLAERGFRVLMVCRDARRGEAARSEVIRKSGNSDVELLTADLASQASIRALAAAVKTMYPMLNVLVNNAGVFLRERQFTEDGLERTFAVNYLAPFLLTHLLLDTLKANAPARIVNLTGAYHRRGRIHSADFQLARGYSGAAANNQSQLARVLFTYELARRLKGSGVTANCVHPGSVRTNITRDLPRTAQVFMNTLFRSLFVRPEKGAKTVIYLVASDEVADVSGAYFVNMRPVRSSEASYDRDLARRLWTHSATLTGSDIEREGVDHDDTNAVSYEAG